MRTAWLRGKRFGGRAVCKAVAYGCVDPEIGQLVGVAAARSSDRPCMVFATEPCGAEGQLPHGEVPPFPASDVFGLIARRIEHDPASRVRPRSPSVHDRALGTLPLPHSRAAAS